MTTSTLKTENGRYTMQMRAWKDYDTDATMMQITLNGYPVNDDEYRRLKLRHVPRFSIDEKEADAILISRTMETT